MKKCKNGRKKKATNYILLMLGGIYNTYLTKIKLHLTALALHCMMIEDILSSPEFARRWKWRLFWTVRGRNQRENHPRDRGGNRFPWSRWRCWRRRSWGDASLHLSRSQGSLLSPLLTASQWFLSLYWLHNRFIHILILLLYCMVAFLQYEIKELIWSWVS